MLPIVRAAAVVGAVLFGLAAPIAAAQPDVFTPEEKSAIERVVRDYLLDHPDVILEVLTILQSRQEQAARGQQAEQLAAQRDQIFHDPGSPVIGNAEGDVTLVEFFDYQCGYCKSMREPLKSLIAADDNLRVVMKEFPILGPASVTAARASLAAERQGRYAAFHDALLAHRGPLTEPVIFGIAEAVGLDLDQLKADMDSDAVAQEITANLRLARQLGINGTPSFVIGDEIVPGAVGVEVLEELIAEQRDRG